MFLRVKNKKKLNLLTVKNVRNDIYFDAVNFAEQAISINNIKMTEIIIEINSKFRVTKY